MSYEPIEYKAYKELEDLGLKVPYDPKNPDINVYAYQLETSNVSIQKIKSIVPSLSYAVFGGEDSKQYMLASEYEVNKNIDKVQIVNKPTIGDNVTYSEYKKLVFTLINIDNDIATIKHELRNIDLLLDVPLDDIAIFKGDLVHYKSITFPELNSNIYIDCDYLGSDYSDIFSLILRLKIMYQGYNLVFLNPDIDLANFLSVLKLSSIYGNIDLLIPYLNAEDKLYTNNFRYLKFIPTILVRETNKFYSFVSEVNINDLGFKDIESFSFFYSVKALYNKGVIDNEIDFSILKNKINQSLTFAKGLYGSYKKEIKELSDKGLEVDGELFISKKEGNIDIEELIKMFNFYKLQYYIDNLEYYIYLIKS